MEKLINVAKNGDVESQEKLGLLFLTGEKVEQDCESVIHWLEQAGNEGREDSQTILGLIYLSDNNTVSNSEKGVYWLTKAAQHGNPEVQFCLGFHYGGGLRGVPQNYTKAVEWFKKAAEQGHAGAQNYLGGHYFNGDVVKQDYAKAFDLFAKSASQGNVEATYRLGLCYLHSMGVDQDDKKAFCCFEKAVEQNYNEARAYLAECYEDGIGTNQDYVKALVLLTECAMCGHLESQRKLGWYYKHGANCIEMNHEKAVEFLSMAAEQGDIASISMLADSYFTGCGVGLDAERAIKLQKEAAEAGLDVAQFSLATYYMFGENDIEINYSEAVKWLSMAAAQNHMESVFLLAECYFYGYGIDIDLAKAIELLSIAAGENHERSQIMLGDCYFSGTGVGKDFNIAAKFYYEAASAGNSRAQYNLGTCYILGHNGFEKNDLEAVKWFGRAAEQGLADAQWAIGDCYYHGDGVCENYSKAFEFYRLAAEQGHAQAQCMLGKRYINGEGVDQNLAEGLSWVSKSAAQNNEEAQDAYPAALYNVKFENGEQSDYEAIYRLNLERAVYGEAMAQFIIGRCYMEGKGVMQDDSLAMEWFQIAAEHGSAKAQYQIGICYLDGVCVEKDLRKAAKWLKLASENEQSKEKSVRYAADIIDDALLKYKAMKNEFSSHRTEVFISYTRADKKYVLELMRYLDFLQLDYGIKIWYDGMIDIGEKWEQEIMTHMSIARVAILMVSQAFLVSQFVRYEELPELLQAAEDEKATIMWVPIDESRVYDTVIKGKNENDMNISSFQSVCDPKKPLSAMRVHERNKVYNSICDSIKTAYGLG